MSGMCLLYGPGNKWCRLTQSTAAAGNIGPRLQAPVCTTRQYTASSNQPYVLLGRVHMSVIWECGHLV
jgi:hypothetical protein